VVTEGVARWEDNKKWQQKVETLRGKFAEKTRELEKAEKTITMLRDAVSRAEKDKAGLHNRIKRYYFSETSFIFSERFSCDTLGFHCTDVVVGCSSAKSVVGGPPMVPNEVVQDLKQNVYKLEEEVSDLLQLGITRLKFSFIVPLVLGCVYLHQLSFSNSPRNKDANNSFHIKRQVSI